MEEQTEPSCRQARAGDWSIVEDGLWRRAAQLLERPIDRARPLCDERRSGCARRPFLCQRRTLPVVEALATGVGQQPIEAARQVLQMVPRRSGAAGLLPQLVVRRV